MEAALTILGSNSALPAQGRHPSAQVLQFNNQACLIDCGEGTQLQMSTYGIRRSRISNIFISHLHGDHIYGLPGLITSYNHYRRSEPLTVFGPKGIKRFIEYSVLITGNKLDFELHVEEFDAEVPNTLIDTAALTVKTVVLTHRIPTSGFLFFIKYPNLKIRPGSFDEYGVPVDQRSLIQKGADFKKPDGSVVPNSVFTLPPPEPLTYAYLSDTSYMPSLAEEVKGFHTIYHEATFLDALVEKAEKTGHSTARQAGRLAKAAEVKKLIIGHFSSRYSDLSVFLKEAGEEFRPTVIAEEGLEVKITLGE